ncbi:MAG: HAD-IA family hydrolase [Synechococcales bacterium]|nr:HAD-IA family hydrolase [Synechococcales bacterium]
MVLSEWVRPFRDEQRNQGRSPAARLHTKQPNPLIAAPPKAASVGITTIIFDFDGTIADSLMAGLKITNRLAKEFGFAPVTPEQLRRWQDLSSYEILKEARIPFFKLPRILRRFKAEMNQEVLTLQAFPGMREVLLQLQSQGYRLGIVSSNSEQNVRDFLRSQALESVFEFVISCPRVLGKSKVLKRLLHQYHLVPETVLYVGDETRDIDAAHQSQVRSAAVTWGFNSPRVLAQHRPSFLLHQPEDLTQIVQSAD